MWMVKEDDADYNDEDENYLPSFPTRKKAKRKNARICLYKKTRPSVKKLKSLINPLYSDYIMSTNSERNDKAKQCHNKKYKTHNLGKWLGLPQQLASHKFYSCFFCTYLYLELDDQLLLTKLLDFCFFCTYLYFILILLRILVHVC